MSSGSKFRSLFVWLTVYWAVQHYFPGLEVNSITRGHKVSHHLYSVKSIAENQWSEPEKPLLGLPAVKSGRGRGVQFCGLLEELFVLVNKVPLHLRHLGHDLLSAQSGDLGFSFPLCFVFVS